MKTIKYVSLIIALVFMLVPSALMAGGGGPEPGSACEAFEGQGYAPPPYLGNATVTLKLHDPFDDGTDDWYYQISGVLNQAGTDCTLTFTDTWYLAVTEGDFDGLKGNMLRDICLEVPVNITINGCDTEQYYETVGVGALKYSGDGNVFSAHFVIMMLQ